MYLPDHFEEARPEELLRTIAAHPLGALVVNGPHGLDANHVPFLVDETSGGKKLLAHVARASPLWTEARDGDEALVIFRAGDTYISPNWYPSKHELHRQVPTWNYRVVHVHGRLYFRDDERFVRGVVARLTRGVNTARFTRTLSILAGSGVPILDALNISAEVIENLPMRDAVQGATLRVREGASISKSLAASRLFPPMMIHLISSGEAGGRLQEMLGRAAAGQEREVDGLIATLLGILQPLLIVIMGAIVALIASWQTQAGHPFAMLVTGLIVGGLVGGLLLRRVILSGGIHTPLKAGRFEYILTNV